VVCAQHLHARGRAGNSPGHRGDAGRHGARPGRTGSAGTDCRADCRRWLCQGAGGGSRALAAGEHLGCPEGAHRFSRLYHRPAGAGDLRFRGAGPGRRLFAMARRGARPQGRVRGAQHARAGRRCHFVGDVRRRADPARGPVDRCPVAGQAAVQRPAVHRSRGGAREARRLLPAGGLGADRGSFLGLAQLVDQPAAELRPRRLGRPPGRPTDFRRPPVFRIGARPGADARKTGRQAVRRALRPESGARDEKPAVGDRRRRRDP